MLTLGGVTTKHKVVYQYEANDRLKQLDHYFGYIAPAISYGYGYNDSGQLTSLGANDTFYLGAPRASETYTVNNLNQYATVGGNTLNYDPNGNLTRWDSPEYGVQRYSYDIENRLQTVAVNGSLLPTHYYDYDGLGRRVYKRTGAILGVGDIFIGGTQTFYLLDGDEEIAEYDQSGTLLRRYVTGPAIDDRIAMIEGNSLSPSVRDRLFYHTDHQGSVVTINENSGARIDRYAYDEYGLLTNAASTEGQPFRYTGRRYDEETGLYYYRARYYSPELGRFLSTDPIGYGDDVNLYAYVKNDPLNLSDPTGKCPMCIPAAPALEEMLVVGAAACVGNPSCTALVGDAAESFLEEWGKLNQAVQMAALVNSVTLLNKLGLFSESSDSDGESDKSDGRKENPSKAESKVWNDKKNAGNGRKTNGENGKKREYYEWDHTHNDIEVYDSKGNHKGSMDPTTGEIYKPAVPGRTINI